jgi:hypothetical protein
MAFQLRIVVVLSTSCKRVWISLTHSLPANDKGIKCDIKILSLSSFLRRHCLRESLRHRDPCE